MGAPGTLLFLQVQHVEDPRQPSKVWKHFGRLHLPKWDLDFMRRVLWKKLPISGRMGHRVGNKLCLLCHRLGDHEHVLRHCCFSAFMFDTTRKAFGRVQREGGAVEPSRLIFEEPALSLQCTQGLVLRAALKGQWSLHCEACFQGTTPSLDDFVARWMGVLEVRQPEKKICLCRDQICNIWLKSCYRGLRGMFKQQQPDPGVFPKSQLPVLQIEHFIQWVMSSHC